MKGMAVIDELTEEHCLNKEAFILYLLNFGYDPSEAESHVSGFENAYLGEYESQEEFARDYLNETSLLGSMPDEWRCYFDWWAVGRDLLLGGSVWRHSGHYFRNI